MAKNDKWVLAVLFFGAISVLMIWIFRPKPQYISSQIIQLLGGGQ